MTLLSVGTLTSSTQAEVYDVAVGEVHVTQGLQDINNWIDLVADRSTAVRVQVLVEDGTPNPVDGITANLQVFVDGQKVADTTVNGFHPPLQPLGWHPSFSIGYLPYENGTLNFELPAAIHGIAPLDNAALSSEDVRFRVELCPPGSICALEDANANNNVWWSDPFTVIRRGVPRIWMVPVRIGGVAPGPAFLVPEVGGAMLEALWPISDADANHLFPGVLPEITVPDLDGSGTISVQGEVDALLDQLATQRQLLVSNGVGPHHLVYVYGWVKEGKISFASGYTPVVQNVRQGWISSWNVGFGEDTPDRGQMILAHEFGHMVGLDHNLSPRFLDHTELLGWDVGGRLHLNPLDMADGTFSVDGRVKTSELFYYHDIMNTSPGYTEDSWIDATSYEAFLTEPRLDDWERLSDFRRCLLEREKYGTLVLQGLPSAGVQAVGRPSFRVFAYPWVTCLQQLIAVVEARPHMIARFILELSGEEADPDGRSKWQKLEIPLDARMRRDHGEGWGPFVVPISVPRDAVVHEVRITSVDDTEPKVDVLLRRSAHVPQVVVTRPKPREKLGQLMTIKWLGKDLDEEANLNYQIAYSANDGRDFVPVAVGLGADETALVVDTRHLPLTKSGQGILRVFVNDGLNTSYADVTGLSIGGNR